MTPLDIVHKYMEIIYGTLHLEELYEILCPDLNFDGPFFSFSSAKDYIQSLKDNPPENFNYKLLNQYSDKTSILILYQFSKGTISTPMAQRFKVSKGKIKDILLIFDTANFA